MSCINVPLVSTALVQPGTERPFLEFNIWQTAKENENEVTKWSGIHDKIIVSVDLLLLLLLIIIIIIIIITVQSWQNHRLCWSPPPPPRHHHHHHSAVLVTNMGTVLLLYPSVHRDMKASWFGTSTLSPNDASVTSHFFLYRGITECYDIQLIEQHVSTTVLFILYKVRLRVSTIHVVILRSLISFKS